MQKKTLFSFILAVLILLNLMVVIFTNSLGSEIENPNDNNLPRQIIPKYSFVNDTIIASGSEVIFTDYVVYIAANLTIDTGGIFQLKNTTLRVNNTGNDSYAYTITVNSGGEFRATDGSTIRNSGDSDYDLVFKTGAKGYITDSIIEHCGHLSEQGLLVESNDVIFNNCLLEDNYYGVHCRGGSPTIKSTEILNSEISSIKCNNSDVKLENCTIDSSLSAQEPDFDLILEKSSTLSLLSTPLPSDESLNLSSDSVLQVYWWVQVIVTNDTAAPLKDVTVNILNDFGDQVESGTTNETGEFGPIEVMEYENRSLKTNISTPHTVKVTLTDYIDQEDEEDISEDTTFEFQLEIRPITGIVAGSIYDESGPVEGVNVTLDLTGLGTTLWTFTSEAGNYSFLDIPAGGPYSINAFLIKNEVGVYQSAINNSVMVEIEETTYVNFTLEKRPLKASAEVQSWDRWIDAVDAKDVNIDTRINVTFGFAMNNTTINQNTIKLQEGDQDVPGIIHEQDSHTKIEYLFLPNYPLDKEKTYALIVSKEVKQLNQNIPILYEDLIIFFDTEFEVFKEISPPDQSIDRDPEDPDVFIRFNEKIALNEVSLKNEFIIKDKSGTVMDTTLEIEDLTNKAKLTPSVPLLGGEEYTVVLSDGLLDENNRLVMRSGTGIEWMFTTEAPVITTTKISGHVNDEETGVGIENATVKLFDSFGFPVGLPVLTDSFGGFEFSDLEPNVEYRIVITSDDYETQEETDLIPTLAEPIIIDIETTKKEVKGEEDEDKGAAIDPMMLGILAIIIIIIIIIIIAMALRKPKEVKFEEEYEGEGEVSGRVETPSAAAASISISSQAPTYTPTEPVYHPPPSGEGTGEPTMVLIMSRCPMCGHRLNNAGECFRCMIAQKYGL